MTVPATIPRNGPYVGDDITTEFDYTFVAWTAEDIRVVRRTESLAEEEDLVLDTDYTVTGVGSESGGTVQLLGNPLASGTSLTILSRVPLKQEMDLVNNNAYDAEVIERAFDRQCRVSQQLSEELNRCVKVPPGDTTDPQVYLAKDIDLAVDAAESFASAAEGYRDSAAGSAANAGVSESNAAESEAMAQEWAENPEDEEITDNPGSYSAFHWATKAASYVGGSGPRFFNEETADPFTDVNQGAIYVADIEGATEIMVRGESDQTPLIVTRAGMTGLNVQVEDLPDHTHDGSDLTDLVGHLCGTGDAGTAARSDHHHAEICIIQDVKAADVDGGSSTSGTWHTRDLNTKIQDTIGITLNANRFTISSGRYLLVGMSPSYCSGFGMARFYSVSGNSYLGNNGPWSRTTTASGDQEYAWAWLLHSISANTVYEFRHYAELTSATTGLGYGYATTSNVFSQVIIIRLGGY